MLFSSLEFLYGFLPAVIAVYFAVPARMKNGVLLAFSLFFYAWGEPRYLLLMLFVILLNYTAGLLTERYLSRRRLSRAVLIASVTMNLLLLGFFKYADFVLSSLSRIPALSGIRPLGILLPIGISFYIFQALSYVIDVYRGEVAAQRSITRFALYVSLFPQLVAGPIVRYRDVDLELSHRTVTPSAVFGGLLTFISGLMKKVFLANAFGLLWENAYHTPASEQTVLGAWLGIIAFMMQIYFDFSGYSDMAIGLGRILGFHFLENFAYPYTAESVADFWRRWHISLSAWFRAYVYIPLGGNRKGKGRTYLNLLVVWALTGLWHGASLNFVVWGLYYWLLLVFEKAFFCRFLDKMPHVLRRGYTLLCVLFGWLIFAFDGTAELLSPSFGIGYALRMLGVGAAGFVSSLDLYELARNGILLAVAVLACLPYPKRLFYRALQKKPTLVTASAALLVTASLILSTAYLADSSYNPFLYFRF